jgi:hypothetical protein
MLTRVIDPASAKRSQGRVPPRRRRSNEWKLFAGWSATQALASNPSADSESSAGIVPQPSPEFATDLTTADIMVETLISWGATHCFGVVGDGINSIIEALRKRQDQIKYIGVRHEEAAAFMASGFAKQMMRLAADKRSMGNPGARTSSSWVPVPAPQVLAREPLF